MPTGPEGEFLCQIISDFIIADSAKFSGLFILFPGLTCDRVYAPESNVSLSYRAAAGFAQAEGEVVYRQRFQEDMGTWTAIGESTTVSRAADSEGPVFTDEPAPKIFRELCERVFSEARRATVWKRRWLKTASRVQAGLSQVTDAEGWVGIGPNNESRFRKSGTKNGAGCCQPAPEGNSYVR